jgi:1,4-dihydroxy-2-naphthoate octaprenyltransferase
VLIGAAWAVARGGQASFSWGVFALVAVGAVALQVAANTFNDYFDWRSGTDLANNEYFQPFSGGSRSIELRLITAPALFRVGLGAIAVATAVGVALTWLCGPEILGFGVAGALSAFFYTAPPLRLVARKGLGELLIGLNFGPLMVAGTAFCLTGTLTVMDFVAGLPIGLLTTAILWVNQFPDAVSDEATGKNNLVVVLGKRAARWGYVALWTAAFGTIVFVAAAGLHPVGVLAALFALPLALPTTRTLLRHYDDRKLVSACSGTIRLQLVTGLLMAAGLRWSSTFTEWML